MVYFAASDLFGGEVLGDLYVFLYVSVVEEDCFHCLGRQGNINGHFCFCDEDFMGRNYMFDEVFKWLKPCVEDAEVK